MPGVRLVLYSVFSVAISWGQGTHRDSWGQRTHRDCDSAKAAFDRILIGSGWIVIPQSFGSPTKNEEGAPGDSIQTYILPGCSIVFHVASADGRITAKKFVWKSVPTVSKTSEHILPSKVFVLLIYQKDGLYTSTSATEARAVGDLTAYVRQKWPVEFPGQPLVQDDERLIEMFFDRQTEAEGYEILELPLLTDSATN